MHVTTRSLKKSSWHSVCYIVTPDLKRLEDSIETYGILSPIVIKPDGTIIDGFHRWNIALSKGIDKVPVVVVEVDDVEAMLLHIDMNRYRGIVIAKYLSWLIQNVLSSKKYSQNELRKRLALTTEEFDLLAEGSLIKMRKIKQHTYSPAWVPVESKTDEPAIKIERPTGHSEQV